MTSHGGGGAGGPGVQANNTGVPPDQKVNKAEGLTTERANLYLYKH
jgi:hypothetical protein